MKFKPILTSLAVLASAGYTTGALSQEQLMLEEIIVTAQKRSESLQNIPLSVSAFGGDEIKSIGAVDLRGLSTRLSNVNVSNDQDNLDIAIRGVSNNRGFAPATAFHIDSIYAGQSQSGLTAFLDVARVEVLRGPQGTLYGRNATAGAINVITNRPDPTVISGSIEATLGDYSLRNIQAVGNLPIIEDTLALRVALLNEDRDGYTEHDGFGFDQDASDDSDLSGGKVRLLWQPTDTVDWLVGYDFSTQEGAGPRFYTDLDHVIPIEDLLAAAGDDPTAIAVTTALQPGTPLANLTPGQRSRVLGDPRDVPVFYANADDPEVVRRNELTQDNKQNALMTELNVDFGTLEMTFLAGYRELETMRRGDNDFWTGSRTSSADVDATEQSYELRLAQSGEVIQWLVGLYYYNNDNESLFDAGAPSGFGTDSTSQALFSQVTWSVSDTLAVTGGLRYSEDEADNSNLLDDTAPVESTSFDNISWKLSVDHNLTEDSLVYGTVSTGYKSGGLNSGSETNPEFDDETLIAYEIGSKNRFLEGRLQLNGAVFYYDYSDLQVSGIEVIPQLDANGNTIPDPDNPDAFLIDSVNQASLNIGDSTMYGAELEWVALVTEDFQVDGAIGLLQTEVGEGLVDNAAVFGAVPTEVDGNELRKAPNATFNLGLQYTRELEVLHGSLAARLDFHYESEQFHDVLNRDADKEDAFTKTDISLTYRAASGFYFVQVFGRNLEDEDVRTTIFQSAGGPLAAFAPPRTYGIRAGVEF